MFNRPLPAPARDIALLICRVIVGVVLFAHGWQKLMINGISGTYGQFEKMGIPLAIVSASFASFVEFVGGVLLIVGALTTTVVALDMVVMVGAAVFVHISNGIFATNGGWELVGVIVAAELALAAVGPGRYSVDHLITTYRSRQDAALGKIQAPVHRAEAPHTGTFAAVVRQAPGRAPQHLGPAQRYGGAAQVVGRVRILEPQPVEPPRVADRARATEQPCTREQPRVVEQAWDPEQRPAVEQPLTSALPVAQPRVAGSSPSQDEQPGGYRPGAGFQPASTAYDPAPMFDPAQRFAAARLLDAAPVTERFAHVGRPAGTGVPRQAQPTPRDDAAPDIAQDVAAALTGNETVPAEAPRPASDLPQRAARSERVRMAATPFQ